ncbi:ceramide glucosyltransferase [Terrarubrum flagellatum]|uniref:ceramide glucosyltransferase n=1 Tax=Terrirubrum flagellatum TaxID=2895980 RepID=UPI003145447E
MIVLPFTIPGLFLAALVSLHVVTIAIAALSCRTTPRRRLVAAKPMPPVSIIRPVSGLDFMIEETLESTFGLDHPDYEILFCAASESDRVVPIVRALLARHPQANARLLVGDDPISDNPKLNNVVKGWRVARHDLIIMCDSNVLLPRDYLQRCLKPWDARTGLVAAPPAGTHVGNFEAEVEAAFLNSYQARWQYAANAIGFGFAQGKNLVFRRDILRPVGGVRALAGELAEDAAATKIVRAQGYEVRLASGPFPQPLGLRDWRSVWNRQTRWARLRRMSFPACYVVEIFAGVLPPTLIAIWWALATDHDVVGTITGLWLLWFALEWALTRIAGWPATFRVIPAMMLRDAMLPLVWLHGWRNKGFVWQGHSMAQGARTG